MNAIVKRLRAVTLYEDGDESDLPDEAAREIENLEALLSKAEHLIRIAWAASYGQEDSLGIMYRKFLDKLESRATYITAREEE